MKINYPYILKRLLKSIEDITDIEYQTRIWINNEGPEYDSYSEHCNTIFDEIEWVLEEPDKFGISTKQQYSLNSFFLEYTSFTDKYDYINEFINTPEWTQIRRSAANVLHVFNYEKHKTTRLFSIISIIRHKNHIKAEFANDNISYEVAMQRVYLRYSLSLVQSIFRKIKDGTLPI